MRFWLREHGLESPDVSAKRVQCLINGWIRPRTDNQAGAGRGGGGGGGGGGEGGGGPLKATATARAGAAATTASIAATAAAARAAARVAAARAREEARARVSAGGKSGKGGAGGGGPVGQIPDEVQDFIDDERRLLRLEGSARLDMNEKTPVEGLLLSYLYHILYQYHQKHLAVLAVQEGMGDNPEMQATDSLRSNKKNQHQRQQQQQQHVQQQQQDCGRGQQQQYKSWVGTDVALLRACLDERASHRMCPS
ncbi:Hypothetical protein NocV09_02600860 [Nannochloropsis oceanica]